MKDIPDPVFNERDDIDKLPVALWLEKANCPVCGCVLERVRHTVETWRAQGRISVEDLDLVKHSCVGCDREYKLPGKYPRLVATTPDGDEYLIYAEKEE